MEGVKEERRRKEFREKGKERRRGGEGEIQRENCKKRGKERMRM